MASRMGGASTNKDEDTMTMRPSSTSVLAVDSADRYPTYQLDYTNATSPYDFQITRNQSILNGFFSRIALTEFVFPYYIPNVNAYTNTLYFTKNGGAVVSGTIPIGFYTPTQLATAVETMLQANGFATATVVYNAPSTVAPALYLPPCCFSIDTNSADDIEFVRGTGPAGSTSTTNLTTFQLFDMMALPVNFGPSTFVNGNTTRCKYIEYIDVICTQLTYNQELKDSSSAPAVRDVLARIYIETENDQPTPVLINSVPTEVVDTIPGTYPFTIYRQFRTPKQILWNKAQPLGNLRFELYNNRGEPLSVPITPNVVADEVAPDWRMTLLVSEN